ncbi:ATP-dependent DNA helicase RecG [Candidatus Vondammii sp. HM_W22]|uniref:ATP-dependent DNA helicase RecG n=1 Tax=Candidatus Vondammii sp. HM_W22 TaxID=2687299 RepID=UPI001F13C13A|nr:ATP-dependent DNA helicase RecG [Candidatus Vondammii sp. HM_W22]
MPTAQGVDATPVTALKGVGPRNAEKLAKIGIMTVQDILFHLPFRYQDRTRIMPLGSLRPGDQAVVEGVIDAAGIRFGRRRSLLIRLSDGTGSITLRFFHFSAAQKANLSRGVRLRCFGEVRNGPASFEIVHPEYQRIDDSAMEESLTPVYPTTDGMHQLTWRGMTEKALALLGEDTLPEWLPDEILNRFKLQDLAKAIRYLHSPPPDADQHLLLEGLHPAQQRLAFEELMAHQLSLRVMRQRQRRIDAPALAAKGELRRRFLKMLPFTLTQAQQRVVEEIDHDLGLHHPMMRLVQGDVGSGKTVVAALAAIQAVEAGHQVALMAPTELLAEQHLQSFRVWLEPLGLEVAWLTGRHKGKAREKVLKEIADGTVRVVVGTHALFQEDVLFDRLGLVIIDEQHRFGVHQRMALREKGRQNGRVPHQLIMTATPIPRTLAMTAYADLDISVIDELPPGRKPVVTVVISDSRRDEVVVRVRNACLEGRQAYWVCTLIEESEVLQCQAAEDAAVLLKEALPELKTGLVHGRLKPAEKEAVMAAFKSGELNLLVATTVIEVGVDVPNASLVIIENPERLGLAQLHQLRGRVGRGAQKSHCVLMYHPPLSGNAQERLGVMRETSDGFVIAQKDLELRGPGEVLGTRQTGEMQFRIADLMRDQSLLEETKGAAEQLLQRSPERVRLLLRRWIGEKQQYIDA